MSTNPEIIRIRKLCYAVILNDPREYEFEGTLAECQHYIASLIN